MTTQLHPQGEHPLLGVPRRDVGTVAVLVVVTAALFAIVAMSGLDDSVQTLDDGFLTAITDVRNPVLTTVAEALDLLGSAIVTVPLRIVLAVFLAIRRRWWHFAAFVGAVVLSEVLIGPLKGLYGRPRPLDPLVATSGASFPSGHAVAAAVTAVALVIALFPEGIRRYWWGTLAAVFALVMALSRAYLGAHWLSDAIAGVLLGVTIALGVAVVVHYLQRRETSDTPGATVPDIVASHE